MSLMKTDSKEALNLSVVSFLCPAGAAPLKAGNFCLNSTVFAVSASLSCRNFDGIHQSISELTHNS